jgi:hypothetical protein
VAGLARHYPVSHHELARVQAAQQVARRAVTKIDCGRDLVRPEIGVGL